ncbi:hypothetical protein CALVIDRAFT_557196 [Calocera viscosa TUFC12733]|uniref:Uncharacterized protein n=1 Tax=Calocera viscosa (strain TUFC12733) TaxID=1330018 RepID=A0A167IZ16_CALVF|nr:hypothetical protein CALVIDRAFT_557196 [Calocera viscosa TUFC12733]
MAAHRPPAPASSPSASSPLQLQVIALPPDLQKQLDDAFLLHELVLRPASILPPGKSVLSLYTQARKRARGAEGEKEDEPLVNGNGNGSGVNSAEIERRVRVQLESAFWDDALEKLSSPTASVQLARLQQLYSDLGEHLAPLLPASDILMQQLREPMSPTSSPLESALYHLAALLQRLLRICAPVRDSAITALLQPITPPPTARDPNLPKLALATFRGILELATELKSDLQDAQIALLGERQLRQLIRKEAAGDERAVVQRFYEGVQLERVWEEWVGDVQGQGEERRWVGRLMLCLGSNRPVQPTIPPRFSSPNPGSSSNFSSSSSSANSERATAREEEKEHNYLPPQLLLESPALFQAQNTIQALTITACLATLVQPSLPSSSNSISNSTPSPGQTQKEEQLRSFTSRVWTLLSGEIAEGVPRRSSVQAQEEGESTKLVHLEEEVVSAWKAQRRKRKALHTPRASLDANSSGTGMQNGTNGASPAPLPEQEQEPDPDTEAERALRKSVSRLLRTEDPVFILLRKRLVQALAVHLSLPLVEEGSGPPSAEATPRTMRTGRRLPGMGGLHVGTTGTGEEEGEREGRGRKWEGRVRGFEGDVLGKAIGELAGELGEVVRWVEEVWEFGKR